MLCYALHSYSNPYKCPVWRACGRDGFCTMVQNTQTDLVVHPYLGLTCPAPGPIEPNGLGPVALEGRLKPTFKPTLPTHSFLGIHIQMQARCKLDDKCPLMLSGCRGLSQAAHKTLLGGLPINFSAPYAAPGWNLNRLGHLFSAICIQGDYNRLCPGC